MNSSFNPEYVHKNGYTYIDTAIVYIRNDIWESNFEWLKGIITHELFTHGLGWIYHSQDNQDISGVPNHPSERNSNITTNERNAKEINLKLNTGTDLNNYLID